MADIAETDGTNDNGPEPIVLTYEDVARGVSPGFLAKLERRTVLTREDIRMVISDRTLERRRAEHAHLRLEEADGIARLLRVIAHAIRVFEDERSADKWLRTENPALGGERPIRMARTDIGAREVEGVLSRIEHGVFS